MGNKVLVHIFSAPQSVFYFMEGQLQFMTKSGFQVHIIFPLDSVYAPKISVRDPNVTLHHVPIERKISPIKDLKCLFKIKSLIKKINPDIVHLHTPKASFLGAVAAKLLGNKNVIYQMHGLVSTDGFTVKKGLVYYLEKTTCSLSKEVFAVSDSLKEYAVKNDYCNEEKIRVIGNGTINGVDYENKFNAERLNIKDFEFDRRQFDGKFIVGFIGRICEDKGIFDFLNVIAVLKEKIPLVGVVVGPLEIGCYFQLKIKSLNIEDNILVYDESKLIERFIAQLDVLLFPTKREGFGLVAAEANALNVPVIAYNIPGVKDAVENNYTGRLVEYGNVKALANAVEQYYFNPLERELHGLNGRKRVMRLFNRLALWKDILYNYNRIIDGR